MIHYLCSTLLLLTTLSADKINIAVAANVSYAIDDLKTAFNKHYPDTKVNVTLGSSGKLTAQIQHGAPYDLFMSANMKYPEALYAAGVAQTKPVVYAQGSLAYLSMKPRVYQKSMAFLMNPSIKKIAIANPKTAPYGKAALEAIQHAGLYDALKSKLVYAETVSQTVSYAMTAVDIGLIAKSSLYSPKMKQFKEGVNWYDVDSSLYRPIDQGIVLLKDNGAVRAFYQFILSDEAKTIFQAFGYQTP
jgi:molybdate transport system substrate-binding protein